ASISCSPPPATVSWFSPSQLKTRTAGVDGGLATTRSRGVSMGAATRAHRSRAALTSSHAASQGFRSSGAAAAARAYDPRDQSHSRLAPVESRHVYGNLTRVSCPAVTLTLAPQPSMNGVATSPLVAT